MDARTISTAADAADANHGSPDTRRRRALARLGLGAGAAYIAPTLLALQSIARTRAMQRRVVANS